LALLNLCTRKAAGRALSRNRLKPPFLRLCGYDVHRLAMRNARLTDLLEICHKPINERRLVFDR
jgi:hypothetical protein